MTEAEQIKIALREIVLGNKYKRFIPGTVVPGSVNGIFCTVQPIDEQEAPIDTRIVTEADATNFLPVPSDNSTVTVGMIDETMGIIVSFGKLDSINIHGTQYGGLVQVANLTTKLNNLEAKVNNLISLLQGVSIPLAPSGTYPFAPIFGGVSSLTPTNRADIENTAIKHG